MRKIRFIAGAVTLLSIAPGLAHAQGWFGVCLDPANTAPYSADYGIANVANELISASVGVSGTVTYGGSAGPCYAPAQTFPASGRLAFGMGSLGSIQSSFDDSMSLTVGWPQDPVGSYTYGMITGNAETPDKATLFANIFSVYRGASNNYWSVTGSGTSNGLPWTAELQGRVVADAVRLQWTITNSGTVAGTYGLLYGCALGMISNRPDSTGATEAFSDIGGGTVKRTAEGYNGLVVLPTGKPLRVQSRWFSTDTDFPASAKFLFGQTDNYGLRVDNNPGPDEPDASKADFFIVANIGNPGLQGILWAGGANYNKMQLTLPLDGTFQKKSDDILIRGTGFIQRYPGQTVAPGASRTIVQYVRTSWGVGSYMDPYTLVIDAPKLVSYTNGTFANSTPNPIKVRAILDNQYADINKSIDQRNVRYIVTLGKGLKPAPTEVGTVDANGLYNIVKNVPLIPKDTRSFVDFSVLSDGVTFGDIPVTLTADPTPGPLRTIVTTIRVGASNNLTVNAGANMVGLPYSFGDSSLDKILTRPDGTFLQTGTDYVAYQWDADLKGYIPTQSVQRGVGYWLVANSPGVLTLKNAAQPPDINGGGFLVSLKQGWNMIASPYPYPVNLSQMVGVAEANPNKALSWDELATAQYVQPSLAYWSPDSTLAAGGSYKFNSSNDFILEPQRGYWVFVTTTQPVRLSWPAVYYEGLPNSGRSVGVDTFKQTDKNWRLQLSARSSTGSDTNNYVGLVADPAKATQLMIPKPPQAPGGKLELAVLDTFRGVETRMAQALSSRTGNQQWTVNVKADGPGDVTVTWPNLASLPRNLRAKLVDVASGQKVDLRSSGSYTYTATQAETRSFTLSIVPSGSSKPVIGNVVVARTSRDNNAPISINYSLSADALVTVRILSGTGKEVYTVTRGRADSAGDNSVTWTLRDSANRAVAPGTYKVEILAETPSGERVRRIVPVNVIR